MNNLRRYQISKSLYSTFYLSVVNAESSVLVVCAGLGTVKIDLKELYDGMNENQLYPLDLGTLFLQTLHPHILDFASQRYLKTSVHSSGEEETT